MYRKFIFLVLTLVILASCGPLYRTTHSYHPPHDGEGRYCTSSCDMMKQTCNNSCANREQNCEMMAATMDLMDYQTCMQRGDKKYCHRHYGKHYHCSDTSCENACTEQYNQCFRNCGGVIETTTTCVANCE